MRSVKPMLKRSTRLGQTWRGSQRRDIFSKIASFSSREPESMSVYASIQQEIANYLATNFDVAFDSIAPEATFEELGVDSLGVLGLATLLENKFGITFESGLMTQIRTFADLMEIVKAKSGELA